jgi:hypothetical protein
VSVSMPIVGLPWPGYYATARHPYRTLAHWQDPAWCGASAGCYVIPNPKSECRSVEIFWLSHVGKFSTGSHCTGRRVYERTWVPAHQSECSE